MSFSTVICYDEGDQKSLFRPRHPIVSGLDIVGMFSALFFISQSSNSANHSYFTAMFLLYFISGMHHWLHYSAWSNRLDHAMIFIFIAMTAMPYWCSLVPFSWPPAGLWLIVAIALIGGISKLFTFFPKVLSGALYSLASLPIIVYIGCCWTEIGTPYNWLWMAGIALFALQLAIYTKELFEFKKFYFGHREVQHVVLLGATTTHGYVALALVQ